MSENDSSSNKPIEVRCPRCKTTTVYDPKNPFRPFCSERCKLIDLGAWASGKYAIPVSSTLDTGAQIDDQDESDGSKSSSDDTSDDGFGPNDLH